MSKKSSERETRITDLIKMDIEAFDRNRSRQANIFLAKNGHAFPEGRDLIFGPGRTDLSGSGAYKYDKRGLAIQGLTILVPQGYGDLTNVTISAAGRIEPLVLRFSAIANLVNLARSKTPPLADRFVIPVQDTQWDGLGQVQHAASDVMNRFARQMDFEEVPMPPEVIEETKDRLNGAAVSFFGAPLDQARAIGAKIDAFGLVRETTPQEYAQRLDMPNLLDLFGIEALVLPPETGKTNMRRRSRGEWVAEESYHGRFGTFGFGWHRKYRDRKDQ